MCRICAINTSTLFFRGPRTVNTCDLDSHAHTRRGRGARQGWRPSARKARRPARPTWRRGGGRRTCRWLHSRKPLVVPGPMCASVHAAWLQLACHEHLWPWSAACPHVATRPLALHTAREDRRLSVRPRSVTPSRQCQRARVSVRSLSRSVPRGGAVAHIAAEHVRAARREA